MLLRLPFLVLAAGVLFIGPTASAAPTGALQQTAALQLITELHQAKTLLETAIHDYDGYRGKAVHEVHQAIRDLEAHHRKTTTTTPGTGTSKPAAPAVAPANPPAAPNAEQQKASDAQLQAAIVILTQAEQTLSTSQHPTHVKAAAHLKEAIGNLNIALMKK